MNDMERRILMHLLNYASSAEEQLLIIARYDYLIGILEIKRMKAWMK